MKITKSVIKKLFLVSIFPFIVLVFFGPELFAVVFGEQWHEAGVFASILAIYLLAQFISSPIVNALTIFEKQLMFLRINIVRTLIIIAVFSYTHYADLDAIAAIVSYSVALAFHYLLTLFGVLFIIRKV